MALARIFTRYPEQTAALAHQLEEQGYLVEVLSPDEAPATLADLEIQLEVCDPAEVLRRAATLAARLHADIAVAPGALIREPASEVASASAAFTPATAEPTPPPPLLPVAIETNNDETRRQRAKRLARAARASGAALAVVAAGTGEFLSCARAAFREQWAQARVGAAEAHSRRQERLLELTRRRAEAHHNAAVLESSRRALSAYLLQLQREYPEALSGTGSNAGLAVESAVRGLRVRIRNLHWKKWEVLVAGVVSAMALFVIGLALLSFQSHPARSPNSGPAQPDRVTLSGAQPKPVATSRPSPAVRKNSPKLAMQARHKLRKAPPKNQDTVADDVVVRHFATPKPTPRTQTAGWKHFSDVTN